MYLTDVQKKKIEEEEKEIKKGATYAFWSLAAERMPKYGKCYPNINLRGGVI